MDKETGKLVYVYGIQCSCYIMGYNAVVMKTGVMKFAHTWIVMDSIMLSECWNKKSKH